jgi:hypothetical protein
VNTEIFCCLVKLGKFCQISVLPVTTIIHYTSTNSNALLVEFAPQVSETPNFTSGEKGQISLGLKIEF